MRSHLKKTALLTLLGYLFLAGIRFTYLQNVPQGVANTRNQQEMATINDVSSMVSEDRAMKSSQNIAGYKTVLQDADTSKAVTIDQKYERIGNIAAATDDFNKDRVLVMEKVKGFKGIVQFENNSGVQGNRILELSVGVHPEKFDSFVEEFKKIGQSTDFRVEKRDKTSEYKDLKAKQDTYIKLRASLIALKQKGGSITDMINLENKILEVEEKIQGFGISLGNFNEENELCTVNLTLKERKYLKVESAYSLVVIVKNIVSALLWSLAYSAGILGLMLLAVAFVYLLLLVIGRLKELSAEYRRKQEGMNLEETPGVALEEGVEKKL